MKKKKYYVTDEDGSKYMIEEELDEVKDEEEIEEVETSNDMTLTPDEIAALKRLAEVADKLLAKADVTDEEEKEEIEVENDDEEEILDTDEEIDIKTTDSKSSFGAINSKKKAKDSIENAVSIEDAWQKRYGG